MKQYFYVSKFRVINFMSYLMKYGGGGVGAVLKLSFAERNCCLFTCLNNQLNVFTVDPVFRNFVEMKCLVALLCLLGLTRTQQSSTAG